MGKKTRWMRVVEILEDEFSVFEKKQGVLPEGAVTEREIHHWRKRTKQIAISTIQQTSKGSKKAIKFVGHLVTSLIITLVPHYLRKLLMSIFGRPN